MSRQPPGAGGAPACGVAGPVAARGALGRSYGPTRPRTEASPRRSLYGGMLCGVETQLEVTHKWGHSPAVVLDRRFVARYAARSGRIVGTASPLTNRVDQGTHGLDVMADMRTATLPEGTSLLEVRGWDVMVGSSQPERSGGWAIALSACGPLGA